jgi:putative transcriptional regulator
MEVAMNGEQIKALRKRLGWSQERLAREVKASWGTVNRWENGKSRPSQMAVELLERWAAANTAAAS